MVENQYLTYAFNQDNRLVYVDDVPNGNECNCTCPKCKGKLCAKNGGDIEKKAHHFAHISGVDCVGAVESVLHKMAKDILLESKCIFLPSKYNNKRGILHHFDRVGVELYDKETQLRPDCIGYNGEKFIWIEFKRSHEVDTNKRNKIISARIDCIEIDLNGCSQNPEEVREFITNSSDRREWITNVKVKNTTAGYNRQDLYYDYKHKYLPINRTFAKDEKGRVVHLFLDNINTNVHSYYCLSCGKKVVAKAENNAYCFVHVEDNDICRDDFYLHEAAKEILYNRFCDSNDTTIYINQEIPCKEKKICPLYDDRGCVKHQITNYGLKKYDYVECLKDYKLPNSPYINDLILKRKNTFDDAIIISIASRGYHVETDSENNRMIKFRVDDEDTLKLLRDNPINEELAFFKNFKNNSSQTVFPIAINRMIQRFVVYNNGKYHMGEEKCSDIINRRHSNVYKLAFLNNHLSLYYTRLHALYHCYNQGMKICYCELCQFCKNSDDSLKMRDKICTLSQEKGTPHHPFQSWIIDCIHFSLDNKNLTKIENEAEDVEVIEINGIK